MKFGIIGALTCLGFVGLASYLSFGVIGGWLHEIHLSPPTWIAVVAGALGLLVAAGVSLLGARRRTVPAWSVLLLPLLAMIMGGVALKTTFGEVADAARQAAPEVRLAYLGLGYALGLSELAIALLWAGLASVGLCLAALPASRARSGEQTDSEPLRWVWTAVGLASGVAGAMVVVAWTGADSLSQPASVGLLLPTLCLLVIPVLFLGARRPGPGQEKRAARSQVEARALAATGLVSALFCLSHAASILPTLQYFGATRQVVPEDGGAEALSQVAPLHLAAQRLELVFPLIAALIALLLLIGVLDRVRSWGPAVVLVIAAILATSLTMRASLESSRGEVAQLSEGGCPPLGGGMAMVFGRPVPSEESSSCSEYDQIAQSAVLTFPLSTSKRAPFVEEEVPSTVITLTRHAVLVDDQRVVDLRDGRVDPSNKHDGEQGFLILPLFDALTESVMHQRMLRSKRASDRPNEPVGPSTAVIAADVSTPFRTLIEVMFTGGQAELLDYQMLASSPADRVRAIQHCGPLPGRRADRPPCFGRTRPAAVAPGSIAGASRRPPVKVVITEEGFEVIRMKASPISAADPGHPPPVDAGVTDGGTVEERDETVLAEVALKDGWPRSCPSGTVTSGRAVPPRCAYDFEALRRSLARVKRQRPGAESIVITAQDAIPLDTVTGVIDAARGPEDAPLFPAFALAPPPRDAGDSPSREPSPSPSP